LADDFITLIKTLLEPIIFATIVVGIARMGIGNGIATIAIAKWEGAFDRSKAEAAFRDRALTTAEGAVPEAVPATT
jgi:Na+/H+-dicarboxylate symporter